VKDSDAGAEETFNQNCFRGPMTDQKQWKACSHYPAYSYDAQEETGRIELFHERQEGGKRDKQGGVICLKSKKVGQCLDHRINRENARQKWRGGTGGPYILAITLTRVGSLLKALWRGKERGSAGAIDRGRKG